ncbi:hypothetical protein [Protaetiibacter mangrovi]|uniref:Bacitracin resistance protein n=1 Tax=Protaetiibacter mangrovi TaxID=2970926 RepID=A0ABT1ZHU8_9MICO|nr:hypothetical protein [Protaetiibacter mangrovi]MCS0500281.1 hypothetical protein [Protaetiibacter mangrovi]TPX02428.1 hypothetical protein FJ656_22450 [Schumannella luteola]
MTDVDREPAEPIGPPLAWRIGVAVLFAALFGWFEFSAASNLIALPPLYSAQGYAEYIPWTTLVLGVLLPPVLYLAALLLGRGRMLSGRVVVFAAGLAATTATALTLYVLA